MKYKLSKRAWEDIGKKAGWMKEAQIDNVPQDFQSADVRRLMGIFSNFQDWSRDAEAEMETWLVNGEYDISFQEAKQRLNYYLAQLQLLS